MKEDKTQFTPKVYKSGGSLVVTIPRNAVQIEGITPGDILSLEIQRVTKAKPDSYDTGETGE